MITKTKFLAICGMAFLAVTGVNAQWDVATPSPMQTQVQPHLNVDIDKDTEAVHFINTNNDPFVFTKVYKLKYADPYEIRPYVMAAVRSRRVDGNETKVEAIKYVDGTGMLIVSAEEYRFSKVPNGMSIDSIIEELDKPELSSSAGRKFYLYYPKYFDSVTLAGIVRKVGLVKADDETELAGGTDLVTADTGLNALLFYTTPSSVKTIQSILNEYDGPTTEAIVKYSIYELSYENDGNIGVDFQAWKNGPGADLFSAAARYSSGWDFVNNTVANSTIKSSHTNFINFNPKWNSKYLDFLVSKSKAKVLTSGSLSVMNNCTATISSTVSIPVIEDGEQIESNVTVGEYMRLTFAYDTSGSPSYPYNTLSAINQKDGSAITLNTPTSTGTVDMVITRTKVGSIYYYNLQLAKNSGCSFSDASRGNLGNTCKAFDVEVSEVTLDDNSNEVTTAVSSWSSDQSLTIAKDMTRVTGTTSFGFEMTITPQVCDKATTVDIDMTNTNLIGFLSDGNARTSQTSLKTKVMVGNSGKQFYIGGLDKKALVRSVSKVPYLGDIPGLGWIFSAESEVVKKSQIVAVLEIVPVAPDTKVSKKYSAEAAKVDNKINNFGIKNKVFDENEYGFDQYLLDKDK